MSGAELVDDGDGLRRALEAIVMVADDPIPTAVLAHVLDVAPATVEQTCGELALDYEASGRGFQLARVAGGYRYQSHPDCDAHVRRFVLDGRSARLSAAGLETLAVVAYRQPVSRAQIAAIRGVSVDGVMRTLVARGYVAEVGRDPGPGQAVMYGTTARFLTELGVDSLDELPPLSELVPDAATAEALERGLRSDPA